MVLLLGAEVLAGVRRSLVVVRILGSLQVVDSILLVVDAVDRVRHSLDGMT